MKTLDEIFEIRNGHSLQLNRLRQTTQTDGVPFVSRKMGDNGIAAYVEAIPGVEAASAGQLSCALSGSGVLTTFLQDRAFYTAYHVACLMPRQEMSGPKKLYYCACICANRFRYGWGRQANRSLKNLFVPDAHEIPSWVEAAGSITFMGADAPLRNGSPPALDTATWKPFVLVALFEIKKGRRLTKANRTPGKTPFVGALDRNNALVGYGHHAALHPGNTITVNYNGIGGVAAAFYQPVAYWCSDDVNALYPRFPLTPAIAMFLIAIIRREKYRFSFGRKWHVERMEKAEIRLPVTSDGSPDWAFMQTYIETLPFSSQL